MLDSRGHTINDMPTDNRNTSFIGPKLNGICPLCGGPNACALAQSGSFDAPCWCRETAINPHAIARVPEAQRNEACICEKCAASRFPLAKGGDTDTPSCEY